MTAPSPLQAAGARVAFAIKVGGKELDPTYQVFSIDVWFAVNKVPRAQIVLFDGSAATRDFPISNTKTFVPGAEIEIEVGYDDGAKARIFAGVVVKHGIEIAGTLGSKLCVDLADPVVAMTLARKSAVFDGKKDSEIIEALCSASRVGKDVAATATKHERVVQFHATDWDLMVLRAEANGLVVMVSGGKVKVQRPGTSQEPVLRVEYGVSVLDLQAEMDAAHQYASAAFKTYAWDCSKQVRLDAAPGAVSVKEAGNLSSAELAKVFNVSTCPLPSGAPLAKEALTDWASAELFRSKLAKIRGHVRFQGSALAEVGKTLELAGLGDRFNGAVFIGGVHHGIRDGRWITTVTFGLSPRPFAVEAPHIAAPDASGQLPAAKGLQTGIVKQVSKDETGEYRVLVNLPLLLQDVHIWARIGTFYASKAVGAVFYPEVDDEVIVGFMNEDPRYPVILGAVYSKARTPHAEPDAENTKKGIVTREKLKVTFDDKDKIIEIATPGGHSIKLDDKDGSITIADSNKNTVKLSKDGVRVDSARDLELTAKGNVSIQATGNLKVSAQGNASMEGVEIVHKAKVKFSAEGSASAEITSPGKLTIRGALVTIN